jgi:hypothetical protein
MADELKAKLNENKTPDQQGNPPAGDAPAESERTGKRISELSDRLSQADKDKKAEEEKRVAAEERATKAEAELAFTKVSSVMKAAEKHKDEILKTAKEKNLAIDEAATLVLAKRGELDGRPSPETSDMGGAATAPATSAPQDKPILTQKEREQKLKEIIEKEGLAPFRNLSINA